MAARWFFELMAARWSSHAYASSLLGLVMKAEDERFKASGFHHIHSESMAAFSREFVPHPHPTGPLLEQSSVR